MLPVRSTWAARGSPHDAYKRWTILGPPRPATAVVELQWGDEGKGKLVDLLAADHDAVVTQTAGRTPGIPWW